MTIRIQLVRLIQLYQHTISNLKILKYHQELSENITIDRKIVLEDLIYLTTLLPDTTKDIQNIIQNLQKATTGIQLDDDTYGTDIVIKHVQQAMQLIKQLD